MIYERLAYPLALTLAGIYLSISRAQPAAQDGETLQPAVRSAVRAPEPAPVASNALDNPPVDDATRKLTAAAPKQVRTPIQYYGTLMLFADYLHQDQAGDRGRLSAGTTGIGIRGTLDSGYGVAAIYQVELGIALDENGVGPSPSSVFPLRNTALGAEGAFGSVRFGSWDTPLKQQILDIGPVRGLNPFDNPLLLNAGHGAPVTVTEGGYTGTILDAAFVRRQGNLVQYWSPAVHGLSARLGYAFNESMTTVEGARVSPHLLSLALRYEVGPLSLRYGYELHRDYFGLSQLASAAGVPSTPSPANPHATDQAHLLVLSLRLEQTRLAAATEYTFFANEDNSEGALDHYGRLLFQLYAEQNFGPHKLFAEFASADSGTCTLVSRTNCSTDGMGALSWTFGYAFALTESASWYAAYHAIHNGKNARYATFPPVGAVQTGEDHHSVGIGCILYL